MELLCVSGSASCSSSNVLLLEAISHQFSSRFSFDVYKEIRELPLFRPEDLEKKLPENIVAFKRRIKNCDAVIISTPEYSHNIPAVLKSAFEWITASGELANKPVLAITFTPHEPRGEWAMKSLLFTLKTLDAKIVTQLPLYKTDVEISNEKINLKGEVEAVISEALKLLEK